MSDVLRLMLDDYAHRQRWVRKVDRLSWALTLILLIGLLTATIGLGRLHLGYLLCSLLALLTRALPVCADATAVVPGFLIKPEFRAPQHRDARAAAHESLRDTYLEPLLIAAGQWKNPERRAELSLDDVEAVVDTLDTSTRARIFPVALAIWCAVAALVAVTLLWLELAYWNGALPTEGGLLRGLLDR